LKPKTVRYRGLIFSANALIFIYKKCEILRSRDRAEKVGGVVGDQENKKKEDKVIVMTITLTVMDFFVNSFFCSLWV
jgi:hypothetical protein